MAYAFVQQKDAIVLSAGTTATTPNTDSALTAGNIVFWCATYGSSSSKTVTMSDSSGLLSFTQCGSIFNATDDGSLVWGYAVVNTSGVTAVTATISSSVSFTGVYIAEYSGLSLTPYTSGEAVAFRSAAPGTGTDAITSGNTPSLATVPAAVVGFCFDRAGANAPAAGTGFTGLSSVWSGYGVSEHKRVTANSAVAATFTASNGSNNYYTAVLVLAEAAPGGIVNTKNLSESLTLSDSINAMRILPILDDTSMIANVFRSIQ